MAVAEVYANDASAVVTAGGTTAPAPGTVETWTLASSTLPAVTTGLTQCHVADPFLPAEIILVTNITGATATVTRGVEGTAPVAHSPGFSVRQTVTAGLFTMFMTLAGGQFTGRVAPAVVALTDGPTLTVDASLGNVYTVTLGGNRTLANPVSPAAGQMFRLVVTQDATGGRLLSYGTAFDFGAAGPPSLSTTPGARDHLGFAYDAASGKWDCLAFAPGY